MTYWRFLLYNVTGGVAWILCFTLMGFFFGSLEVVKKNFSLVILAIIVISVMPGVIEYLRQNRRARGERRGA
jgi:membrane-associated protein